MYIPITKTEEKCAGQLSYGFNIQDKLEGWTISVLFSHEGNFSTPQNSLVNVKEKSY